MPQPAMRRTVSPSSTAERSAMAHSPSPAASIQPTGPAHRSRGICSISSMSESEVAVGVPPTAADGWSAAASWSDDTVAASWTTPATSVARCITLGRCSTNGDSGTFIDEQCGARASATERTAYSCSSRSFEERARVAARARSCSSSPVRWIVPASTREVTRPRSRRTSISGVAPKRLSTWNVQHIGYCSASRATGHRTSTGRSARATRSRASTTFSRSPALMRRTASATTDIHCAPSSEPSA